MTSYKPFTIGEVLSVSWEIVKRKFLFFIVIMIIMLLTVTILDSITHSANWILLKTASVVLAYIVSWVFETGMINISLILCDGKRPQYSDMFPPFPLLLNFIGASILYALIIFVGLLLLVIPGIIWSVSFSLYGFSIVDEGLEPVSALKKSSELTRGMRWEIFGLIIILTALNTIGALLLGLGLLVTVPLSFVSMSYVYRKLESHRR